MLQVAGDPKEVADLILHDATFSPQELVFRDGRVRIEGIERWGWEEAVTTEEGKIERSVEPKRLSWEIVAQLGRAAQKRKWAMEGIENVCRARLGDPGEGIP